MHSRKYSFETCGVRNWRITLFCIQSKLCKDIFRRSPWGLLKSLSLILFSTLLFLLSARKIYFQEQLFFEYFCFAAKRVFEIYNDTLDLVGVDFEINIWSNSKMTALQNEHIQSSTITRKLYEFIYIYYFI